MAVQKMRDKKSHHGKWTACLNSTDRLLISFWIFLACVSLAFFTRIPHWPFLILSNLAAAVVTCVLAYASQSTALRWLRWIHDWSAFPLILFTYKQVHYLIGPIHGRRDFDHLLVAADRWLFGSDPTVWLARFSHPYLTELLQIAYALFYVYFIVVGIELYRKSDSRPFSHFRFTVVYGFFISYIGYFFLPAAGPRFTLHDFSKTGSELPGLFFTPFLRRFVNFFESIPADVTNDIAHAAAQRDVFPSGHTMMTIVVIILAYRYRLKLRHDVLAAGLLLILATIYLRYQYVVDVIAGAALALLCLATTKKLYGNFQNPSDSVSE